MDRNQETALTQMKKSIEKLGSSTEVRKNDTLFFSYCKVFTDFGAYIFTRRSFGNKTLFSRASGKSYGEKTLMRFLIARSMDPEKAAKMFYQWQKWRAEMVPHGYISDSEVADELAAEKIYLQGLSQNGHPVVMVKSNKHFASKDQVQFKKFIIHLLDKTIASSFNGREIGNEKLIGIVDLQNITYSNADLRGMITGFQFLQAYYPERLATCYILHMPQFFVTIWRFVCRFIDKATQDKVRIVTSEEQKEAFIREVGEDVLPEGYGGRAKLVLLQDVAVNY